MTYVGGVRAALAGAGDPGRALAQRAVLVANLDDSAWGREALKHLRSAQTGTSSTAPTA